MKVKFILPSLTEAGNPYWRPIKYSLFPPLGLATLAAYLDQDDEAVLQDQHVEVLNLNDEPDLVLIQVYITNAKRAYAIAEQYRNKGVFVALGGLHVTSLPDEAAAVCGCDFHRPGGADLSDLSARFQKQCAPETICVRRRTDAQRPAANPPGFDQAAKISCSQFAGYFQRMSASLRFLLQRCLLQRRQIILHPAG